MSTTSYRVRLLQIITFAAGLYFVLDFILPDGMFASAVLQTLQLFSDHPSLRIEPKALDEHVTDGVILVGSMAVGLGLINLIALHGSRILFVRRGWINSVALIFGLVVMMAASVGDWLIQRNSTSISAAFFNLAQFAERIVDDDDKQVANLPALTTRLEKLQEAGQAELNRLSDNEVWLKARVDPSEDTIEVAALRTASESASAAFGISNFVLKYSGDKVALKALGEISEHMSHVGVAYGNLLRNRSQREFWHKLYSFLNEGLFVSLGSAMFSLLGVYIAVAAFRAFRVRSFESALMMSAAIIVMFGQISFGVWLWQDLPQMRQWLMEVPNSAAFRAIKFGSAIAGLVLAIRMWLSIESQTFGGERKS